MPRIMVFGFFFLFQIGFAIWAPLPFVLRPITPEGFSYKETLLAADIDHDGDSDFFGGNGRPGRSWWFEHKSDGWQRRLVSDSELTDVGAALMDVDGDGWIDKVSSGFWYRNPGFPNGGLPAGAPDPAFTACRYSTLEYVHDIYTADFDGDGKLDVLTIDNYGIRWFRTPPADSACGPWQEHMINGLTDDPLQHGGLAAGDIDGDGDMDVSRMDRWFENAHGKGTAWIEHAGIPFGAKRTGGWGLSGRALVYDLDKDGHNDLVEAECDAPNGRVAWFANPDGKGLRWERHLVKDSVDGQDFHSMILADFDGDGDPDLFSAGSSSSEGVPKAYLWENLDGHGGQWEEHVILEGPLRIHDATVADLDGDGDLDILAKDWAEGSQFYLENQLVPNAGAGVRGLKRESRTGAGLKASLPTGKAVYRHNGRYHAANGRMDPGRKLHR
ncbi:MAG: VCBS repeat-containing protein [Fibrobacteria bacterium]